MSLARSHGVVIQGVSGIIVTIEAYLSQGLPGMSLVGLPDTAVGESRDRVRAAIQNSKLSWPGERRITVGLSPASIHKRGAMLDLGIALAVLAAHQQVPERLDVVAVGELALDGTVRDVTGVLVATLTARKAGKAVILVPQQQMAEAMLIPGIDVVGVCNLADAVAYLRGEPRDDVAPPVASSVPRSDLDLRDVRGQHEARQALEIAAAGGHHMAMIGSPGVGKSMLAARLPSLLPELDDDLAIEVTSIHSVAGVLQSGQGLLRQAPFQSPHHSATAASLIGGGNSIVKVGMVTLAHGGVLCLDEAAEFDRVVLDALRIPLESGQVVIARAGFTAVLPAQFQLVLASNPCPCGKFVDTGAECSCTSTVRRRYFSRISGPLLDRIDLRVRLQKPTVADFDDSLGEPESSASVAARVLDARRRASQRFAGTPWSLNSHVPGAIIRRQFPLRTDAMKFLRQSLGAMSARGFDRVMRVAWTIADLHDHEQPTPDDVRRALAFRDGDGSWQ